MSLATTMGESRFPVWLAAALLVLVTIALYWPATRCDFVNTDDPDYVTANPHVLGDLNWEGVKWAFLNPVSCNWHPLTVLSHMVNCQLFGLNPWGHHLTNVLFHALNAALVFALFRQLTGAFWRSLMVAALFGLHPLHVESVAWVAERKDVLSACFGLLALIFYARYAQKVTSGEWRVASGDSLNPSSYLRPLTSVHYWLSLFFFTCGLMSKPILVTWPFAMLLLDYWPLRRFEFSTLDSRLSIIWRLMAEKIPFFALAAAASVVTFVVQKVGGSIVAGGSLPLGLRSANALVSYCRYLGNIFWPKDMAVLYPHPGEWPIEEVFLAGVLILGISVILFIKRRRYPFLLIGWLWFCGMLVPVIGFVQTGSQAMADRHTYLPSLGMLMFAVWGAYEPTRRWRYHVIALSMAGSAALVLCLALTRQQIGYWQDSETLFRHALEVTENNYVAHYNLGTALGIKGQTDEAIIQFHEAIRLNPDYADAHDNLGVGLVKRGQIDEAIIQFQEALRLKPDDPEVHNNLGTALGMKGQTEEAIIQFREALRLKPDHANARNNLGFALGRKGKRDGGIR